MKKSFSEFIKDRVFLDGGMGSALIKAGVSSAGAEVLNIERPDLIRGIHEKYFSAGSDVVYANTFGCNRNKADLSRYSLKELIKAGINNALDACAKYGGYVLYDCGPTGEMLYPYGRLSFDDAYSIFAEQAEIVKGSGVDGVVIETVADLQEMRAAILAFKEITGLPVVCSMTFEKSGRTFAGVSAESFVMTAQSLGVEAVGANCGLGPESMEPIIKKMSEYASVPVFAKPNAGLPAYVDGKTIYSVGAEDFALQMKKLALAGASVLGGCCGTDEEYIKRTIAETADLPLSEKRTPPDGVCSYSHAVLFDGKRPFIIGERLNPTNKPLLKKAIEEDDFDYVLSVCVEQAGQGADMLDYNLGTPGVNEEEKLKNAIAYAQAVADLPVVVDSPRKNAMESAVRTTCGVCVINSVSGEEKSAEKVFPTAKKYGSYIIALCLDENGIPKDSDGRIEIAKKIIKRAEKYGIPKNKLIFDPLALSVSVNVNNAVTAIETLRRLRDELGVKTTIGLSNISYGLPDRRKINGAFLKKLTEEKITCVIADPSLKENDDRLAMRLLEGKDRNCEEYVGANSQTPVAEEKEVADLTYCIKKGLIEEAVKAVKTTANENNYSSVIEECVIKGLNELGAAYERGEAFLPQLIAGSEAAKSALAYIKNKFIKDSETAKATVIVATVKGDVHDIGKNIVKAVTANYGYRIIDLGKDVPTEKITEAIKKYSPQAVGLSALMTTTIDNMTESVERIKKEFPDIPVLVGGAVVTAAYAEKVGAIYSKDAQENVKILENLFGNR